ncbi:MAG: VOC family protein [Acidobacteria bacterium]|nr:MAG: VOC family protein [Acidobacteriota bacterium]
MSSNVKPIPEGYNSVTPYLIVKGAAKAIEFYKQAFGATETLRMPQPDGRIVHAELKIGDSTIMLADEFPERNIRGPESLGGTPVMIHLYIDGVDAVAKRAVALGAKEIRPVQNQFYGDRSGIFADPFGHQWNISTHVEDLSPEEISNRAAAAGH